MNNKLLVMLLFVGWSFLCWRIYVCQIKQKCPGQTPKIAVTALPTASETELSTSEALSNANAQEAKSTTHDTTATLDVTESAQAKSDKMSERPAIESEPSRANSGTAPEEHVSIEETADEAVIHFPFNSTRKVDNQEMDAFLTRFAARLKGSNEKVLITGHTDGIGDAETNSALALKRSQSIRDILVQKGVPAKSITCKSYGERKPVASDDTPQGRYKNRRAILTIQ